jgi:hypothetical protein
MRDRRSFAVLLLLTALALVLVHQPPRSAKAQGSGTPAQRSLGDAWNVAPSISSGIFTTPLISTACIDSQHQQHIPSILRIGVSVKVASILYVTETNAATTQTTALNSGTALSANQDYTFVREIRSTADAAAAQVLQYNFVLGTNCQYNYIRVTECLDGVD